MASRALLSRLPTIFFSSVSRSLTIFRPSTLRLRPVIPLAERLLAGAAFSSGAARSLSTRATTSSLNDPQPNWSNRPPKETILLDGCDFEHWLVVMEPPDPNLTRDEIIDSYIKTLAQVVGSEQEARMKIYSVSTKHYFAFGALVSEELSYKIKELPRVRWVLPDSYLDVKNKDYGGEPFINGEAVPYDPKYHEEWVRNNARANERSRRNDRPRNFDRSRNFERRRENMMNFQNREAPPMQNQEPPRDPQASNMAGMPNRDMPNRDHGGMQGHGNQGPVPGPQGNVGPQGNYIPNRDGAGYPAGHGPQPGGQSFQGGNPGGNPPVAPGYTGAGQGYRHGGPGGAGGAMPGAPGYQGGSPGGYQGSQGYQGINPGGSPPGGPTYQGGNQGYQGNYQGSAQGYQGGGPAYQGNNSGYQGGAPGYQGGSQGYQGNSSGYQGGGSGYQGGSQGNQGGGPGYQAPVSGSQGYPAHQGRDVGGRDF